MTPPEAGAAVTLAPGLLWARLPVPFKPGHVNIYALADDDGWTLIDCGPDLPPAREAFATLRAGPLAGRIARLLVTHHHLDHIGLAGHILAAEPGARLLMSRPAYLTGRMMILDRQEVASEAMIAFWRRAGMAGERLAARVASRPFVMADAAAPLPQGYVRLVEGQRLRLGGRDWTVRLGEGHAPGHVTLWSDGMVLCGDQALQTISPNLGVNAVEPDADSIGAFLESCARLGAVADDAVLALPGHGAPFRGLASRLATMAANHRAALARLEAAFAATPGTAEDGFAPLYRRPIGAAEYPLALAEAVGHVNHLAAQGRIEPAGLTAEGGQLWRARTGRA